MSVTVYTFAGTFKWAFVQNPSPKYGNYSVNFYPADDATRRAVKATGVRNAVKEDDDGGWFYTFRNDEPPVVVMADGSPVTGLIGNGSAGRIQLTVEEFTSAKYGKQTRGKLTGVIVDNLLVYEPKESTELPA